MWWLIQLQCCCLYFLPEFFRMQKVVNHSSQCSKLPVIVGLSLLLSSCELLHFWRNWCKYKGPSPCQFQVGTKLSNLQAQVKVKRVQLIVVKYPAVHSTLCHCNFLLTKGVGCYTGKYCSYPLPQIKFLGY